MLVYMAVDICALQTATCMLIKHGDSITAVKTLACCYAWQHMQLASAHYLSKDLSMSCMA